MKAFIESQFNYSLLIWMLYPKTLNNKINPIHERALRTVSSLTRIHFSMNSLIRVSPLQFIKKMSKVHSNIWISSWPIYNNITWSFQDQQNNTIRFKNEQWTKTVKYGTEHINFLRLKISALLSQNPRWKDRSF